MLTVLIVLAVIGAVFIVPTPKPKTVTVVEHHHHHHVTVVHQPVYVDARVLVIQAQIAAAEARGELEPVRLPEARTLLNPATAIERYRSQERKLS